jgi:hypothetical protein
MEQKMSKLIMKKPVVVLSLLVALGAAAAPAFAQQYNPGGAIVGGLIGGALGAQVHGRDRGVATAALATIGAVIGSQAGTSYAPAPAYAQPVYAEPVYAEPAYAPPVVYSEPVYARPPVVYGPPVVVEYRDRWDGPYWRHHHHRYDRY